MYLGEKAAGNRIVESSSSCRSSLPPPSPMVPFTTCDTAESQHFINPGPPAVTTQSLSQGFCLPLSASSMLPEAPQTSSFSPVSDSLPMWNTSPSSPLPDTLMVQPPPPIWNLLSQDSSTTPVVDGNENAFSCGPYTSEPPMPNSNPPDSVLATNPVGWNENAQSGPYTSESPMPNSNIPDSVLATNPVGWNENAQSGPYTSEPPMPNSNLLDSVLATNPVGWNENAQSGPYTSEPPMPNSNLPDSVLATNPVGWNENAQSGPFTSVPTPSSNNPVGWNENAFINGPNHLQPPMSSVNVQDPVYSNHPVANCNVNAFINGPNHLQPPMSSVNVQDPVYSNNTVADWNVNAFSSGPCTSQQPFMSDLNVHNHASSSTNPVGWNENAFSRNLVTSEPLTSNWHLHGNFPSPSYHWNPQNVSITNLRGWNANASSLGPSTSQPRNRQNVSSANPRGWNANTSSRGPYNSQPRNLQNVSSANPRGWNANTFSRGPYNMHPPSHMNVQNPIPNTNSVSLNENASNVQFQNGPATPHVLNQIPASSNPTETVSDPRRGKRILEYGESSAQHSQEKRSRYVPDVDERNRILEKEVYTLKQEKEILINSFNRMYNQNQTNQQQSRYGDVDNLIPQLLAETERRNQVTQENQNVGQFSRMNGSFQGR